MPCRARATIPRERRVAECEKRVTTTTPETVQLTWSDGEPRGEPMPCLGVIRDCEETDFGWRGMMPNGTLRRGPRVAVGFRKNAEATIPPSPMQFFRDGKRIGAYLIERA